MAIERSMFAIGWLQMITALCSLALCAKDYSDISQTSTRPVSQAVIFIGLILAPLSLLICGFIGVLISTVQNKIAKIVHITITAQTTIGVAVNVWLFVYSLTTTTMREKRRAASQCLIASLLCLFTCVGYLMYRAIQLIIRKKKGDYLFEGEKGIFKT